MFVSDRTYCSIVLNTAIGARSLAGGGKPMKRTRLDIVAGETRIYLTAIAIVALISANTVAAAWGAGLQNENWAVGLEALSSCCDGFYNTASGFGALSRNLGDYNTADGFEALGVSSVPVDFPPPLTGSNDTASGAYALFNDLTGYSNTATGARSLFFNTTGSDDSATGVNALYSNTTGAVNTADGENALYSNISGSRNTAVGNGALYSNNTGSGNTASGVSALSANAGGTSIGDINMLLWLIHPTFIY
jgi:trimeric autotransporter adhesin